jgi:hypothetical protein
MCRDVHDCFVGELNAVVEFETLQMAAIACDSHDCVVSKLSTARDIETLKPYAVLCDCHHGVVCQLIQTRHIQREQTSVHINEWLEAQIRELATICQGQALDALAVLHPEEWTIADLASQSGHVESLDQILICEEFLALPNRSHDTVYALPFVHRWSVP